MGLFDAGRLKKELAKKEAQIEDLERQRQSLNFKLAKLEHDVGMAKHAMDARIERAKKTAELDAREQIVADAEKGLEEWKDLVSSRFDEEIETLKLLLVSIIKRLPVAIVQEGGASGGDD